VVRAGVSESRRRSMANIGLLEVHDDVLAGPKRQGVGCKSERIQLQAVMGSQDI
jgi:hypothetical protein